MQDLSSLNLAFTFCMIENYALYIGKSDNLQKQFSTYLDTDFEGNSCKQNTHTYQGIFTSNQKEQKKNISEQFKIKYGQLPCCNSEID